MKRPIPDLRPHWSDPNLPCIRTYRMGDGRLLTEVSPHYEHRYAQHRLENAIAPNWQDDPTYDLRRKK